MKKTVLLIALLLGGCGDVEWFPEPGAKGDTQASIQSTDVGNLVISVRNDSGNYTVTTTKGVFSTYTSLAAPYQTPVKLERYTDPVTGLQIGKALRALQQSILVREILALVEQP